MKYIKVQAWRAMRSIGRVLSLVSVLANHSLNLGRTMLEYPKLEVFHRQVSQDHLRKEPF
jgi:hypothetical protein